MAIRELTPLGSWYGEARESVDGMAIQELVTSAQLVMPFTNVRDGPDCYGVFLNEEDSCVARNSSSVGRSVRGLLDTWGQRGGAGERRGRIAVYMSWTCSA